MSISSYKYYITLFFFIGSFSGFSQVKKSGATSPKQANQKITHSNSIQSAASTAPIKCLNKKLSLAIHIVTDSLYHPNISQAQINTALATLNTDFAPICLSFFICKQDTIDNYKYYQFDQIQETPEVHNLYEVQNMINVYIVGSITSAPEAGFALKTGNFMILSHGCVTDGKCWSHEMGHFFSLAHTFEPTNPLEHVNGDNCATAGDAICDTPADINPAPVNASCQWTGALNDGTGYYAPIIGNIMSYHPAVCKTPFTVGQLNKMLNWYLSYRNYLY